VKEIDRMTDPTGESIGAQSAAQAKAGKYLTFKLGAEDYGLEILKVQEIIGILKVTRVPRLPDFIRGVINLRGKVIPVIDLRLKFGMEAKADTERTCIIVVQVSHASSKLITGIIVDDVSEVLNITADQLEPPPAFDTSVDVRFLFGMGKIGQKVVMLLDIDRVLSSEQLSIAQQVAKEN
jgi:purine-binding chemotaxis protein CheW